MRAPDLDEGGDEEVGRFVQSARGFRPLPGDISRPPREWAERFFNVQRWTEMPRGGHFAAMEEPELLADDIRMVPDISRWTCGLENSRDRSYAEVFDWFPCWAANAP